MYVKISLRLHVYFTVNFSYVSSTDTLATYLSKIIHAKVIVSGMKGMISYTICTTSLMINKPDFLLYYTLIILKLVFRKGIHK